MTEIPWLYAGVLFFAAIMGSAFFGFSKKQNGPGLKLLLSFSAAYLLGLILLHLFPELFTSGIPHVGYYVLLGFILQVILDFFSHGVEHGHAHTHHHKGDHFFFMVMFALWVHSFIEGMPFGAPITEHTHGTTHAWHQAHDHRNALLLGISLHKITEALVFTGLLLNSGWSRQRTFFWLIVFALVAPAGAFFHYFMHQKGWMYSGDFTYPITGILIGILLHVSTTIIFESEEGHRFNRMKFLAIIAGIILAALLHT